MYDITLAPWPQPSQEKDQADVLTQHVKELRPDPPPPGLAYCSIVTKA
jgi:hypothetical protein